jgi:hypothetical protein
MAVKSVADALNNGEDADWGLLYQGQSRESLLGQEFFDLCDWFYESIWKRAHVKDI